MPDFSQSKFKFMPSTPKLIKYLVVSSLFFGFLSGFFNSALGAKFGISFVTLFGLSTKGLFSYYLWQPFTFLFLPQAEGSLSFYFLFTLSFDVYLLWYIGCKVFHLFGSKTTLKLFFIPSMIAGLLSCSLGYFLHFGTPLYGLSFAMISLITAYTFSNPDSHFHFMPMQSLQTRWMGLGLFILYIFQDLSNLDFTALLAHLLVASITYFYLLYFHNLSSPFSFTNKLDNFILSKKKKNKFSKPSKVIYLYEDEVRRESRIDKTFNKIKNNEALNIWDKIKLRSYRNSKS